MPIKTWTGMADKVSLSLHNNISLARPSIPVVGPHLQCPPHTTPTLPRVPSSIFYSEIDYYDAVAQQAEQEYAAARAGSGHRAAAARRLLPPAVGDIGADDSDNVQSVYLPVLDLLRMFVPIPNIRFRFLLNSKRTLSSSRVVRIAWFPLRVVSRSAVAFVYVGHVNGWIVYAKEVWLYFR
ncbi:hypothetical protein NUW54_g11731 [Trametes sanguinea]|uniref:Uncharacterized protein n=1 Tax=Trametes sanguinea TaxID=158606 RepID=A0ACC1N972_9APHY|nr:hypothetical protein NUW54_g11731 [Trametes sanguinea]